MSGPCHRFASAFGEWYAACGFENSPAGRTAFAQRLKDHAGRKLRNMGPAHVDGWLKGYIVPTVDEMIALYESDPQREDHLDLHHALRLRYAMYVPDSGLPALRDAAAMDALHAEPDARDALAGHPSRFRHVSRRHRPGDMSRAETEFQQRLATMLHDSLPQGRDGMTNLVAALARKMPPEAPFSRTLVEDWMYKGKLPTHPEQLRAIAEALYDQSLATHFHMPWQPLARELPERYDAMLRESADSAWQEAKKAGRAGSMLQITRTRFVDEQKAFFAPKYDAYSVSMLESGKGLAKAQVREDAYKDVLWAAERAREALSGKLGIAVEPWILDPNSREPGEAAERAKERGRDLHKALISEYGMKRD